MAFARKAHPTNWSTREMIKMIEEEIQQNRHSLLIISFPHPCTNCMYFDMYKKEEIDSPILSSDWLDVKNFTIAHLQQLGETYY